MHSLNRSLICKAQKFITAENVHRVKTWIFCYEASEPESPRRRRYEQLLREFVTTKNLMAAARIQAKFALARGIDLRRASTALDEEIRRWYEQ